MLYSLCFWCDDGILEVMYLLQVLLVVMNELELCSTGTEEVERVLTDDVLILFGG